MKWSAPLPYLFSFLLAAVVWAYVPGSPALANPFTQKKASAPPAVMETGTVDSSPATPGVLMTITLWQHKIRTQMSQWIRQAETGGRTAPLIWVLGAALVYGMIHSAGPGHGKAVALSYILGFRPGIGRGLLFGNILAFTHGMSGVVLVLVVKFGFQASMALSLETVTRITQIISFSLITLIGIYLFAAPLVKGLKKRNLPPVTDHNAPLIETKSPSPDRPPSLATAFTMGMIPCPGVVMVMLFCLSMDLPLFGILCGLAISLGMALTLSAVVLAGTMGKTALVDSLPPDTAGRAEALVECLAGLVMGSLGLLFLLAAL